MKVKLKKDRHTNGEYTGDYTTLDGRFTIGKGEALSICAGPHPQRRGGYCPGWMDHTYVSWEVWDNERGEYLNGEPHYDTKRDAVAALEQHLSFECPIRLKPTTRMVYV